MLKRFSLFFCTVLVFLWNPLKINSPTSLRDDKSFKLQNSIFCLAQPFSSSLSLGVEGGGSESLPPLESAKPSKRNHLNSSFLRIKEHPSTPSTISIRVRTYRHFCIHIISPWRSKKWMTTFIYSEATEKISLVIWL